MLEKQFDLYANKFDLKDPNLLSRYHHSYRVMDLCVKYAKELNWSKEDIELAKIIGLLHDFGRFKQYEKYHSFSDKDTLDHADYSVKQLFDNNEIVKFTDKKEWYDIIKFAIENHNKLRIPTCNDVQKIKFAKLIRDADKVDIMYVLGKSHEITRKVDNSLISERVMQCLKNKQPISIKDIQNNNDLLVLNFAFTFDINYDVVLNDFKKNLKGFYSVLQHNSIFKEVYSIVINYLDERMDNINKGEI